MTKENPLELCDNCKEFDILVNKDGDPNAKNCNDVLVICNHEKNESLKNYNIDCKFC